MHRSLIALTLALPLVACGPSDSNTPGGRDQTTSAEYWGLADRRCLTYTDKDGHPWYTVEILADDTTIAGIDTWRLVHRHNGFLQREDSLERVGRTLVLWRRKVALATGERLGRFEPPPVFLRERLETGDSVESETSAIVNESGARTEETQVFRTGALEEEPVNGPDGEVMARKLMFSQETSAGTEVELGWFLPNVGFVKLDPPGDEVVKGQVTLTKVKQLGEGETCP